METVKKLEQSGKHEKYEFEYREVMSNQIVFPEYQRRPRALKLAMIEGDFDENIANEPKVSFRDGKYYSLDGQHTVLARVSRNGGKPLKILCKVYYGMPPEKEAYYFEQQTGYSTKLNNPEKQRARLFRGDDVVAKIKTIAELYGFQYDFSMSGGHNCILLRRRRAMLYQVWRGSVYYDAFNSEGGMGWRSCFAEKGNHSWSWVLLQQVRPSHG